MTHAELFLAMGITFSCLCIVLYLANKTANNERRKNYENRQY